MSEWKNIFRQWREKLWWASLPLCFVGLFLLDASLRYFYKFAGSTRFLDWRALMFTTCWSLVLTGLVALLPPLGKRILLGLYAGFFGLLTVAHGVLFNVLGKFFSWSDINFAGDGARFFSWSYMQLRKALLLCILVAVLCLVLAAVLVPKKQPGKRHWPLRVGAVCVMLLSGVGIFQVHSSLLPHEDSMWWGNTFDPHSEAQAYKDFSDSTRNLLICGLYQYTVRDFLVSFGLEGSSVDLGKLDDYYEERAQEISGDNEMTGVFQDKNLIMVMLESVDTWLLTPEYMPNLYALQQGGTNFTHHYTPLFLSAATFGTEFISQTGLLPSMTGLPSSAYSTNSFPFSLAHLFSAQGYTTGSYHPSYPFIYSRGTIHENLGMPYHSGEDLGMGDYTRDSLMMNGYDQMVSTDEPFYSFIITYSGHGPYNEELASISDPHLEAARAAVAQSGVTGSDANMEEYTLAVAHAMETDQFIGELVDRLDQDGLLEDTVLVFYTDHYGKYMSDLEFIGELKGVDTSGPELYRTPFFYYLKGQEPQTVDKYVYSGDIAPTIANLFDLPVPMEYFSGDDAFGDQGGVVMFPNAEWYDGETYFTSNYQGEVTPEMEETTALVQRREQASYDTLKSDYFAARGITLEDSGES